MLLPVQHEKLTFDVAFERITVLTGLPAHDLMPLSVVLILAIALVDIWALLIPIQLVFFAWPAYVSVRHLERDTSSGIDAQVSEQSLRRLVDWWMCRGACALLVDFVVGHFSSGPSPCLRNILDVSGQVVLLVYSRQVEVPSWEVARAAFTAHMQPLEPIEIATVLEEVIVPVNLDNPVVLEDILEGKSFSASYTSSTPTKLAPLSPEAQSPVFSEFSLDSPSFSADWTAPPSNPPPVLDNDSRPHELVDVALQAEPVSLVQYVPLVEVDNIAAAPSSTLRVNLASELPLPDVQVVDKSQAGTETSAKKVEEVIVLARTLPAVVPEPSAMTEPKDDASRPTRNSHIQYNGSSLTPAIDEDYFSRKATIVDPSAPTQRIAGPASFAMPPARNSSLATANPQSILRQPSAMIINDRAATSLPLLRLSSGSSFTSSIERPVSDIAQSADETLRLLLEDEGSFVLEPYSAMEIHEVKVASPQVIVKPPPPPSDQHIVVPRPSREPERKMSHLSMLLQQEPDFLLGVPSAPTPPQPALLRVPVSERLAVPVATRRKSIAKDPRAHRPPPPRKHSLDAMPQQRLSMAPMTRKVSSLGKGQMNEMQPFLERQLSSNRQFDGAGLP